jgi:hypothetical protein
LFCRYLFGLLTLAYRAPGLYYDEMAAQFVPLEGWPRRARPLPEATRRTTYALKKAKVLGAAIDKSSSLIYHTFNMI